MTITQRRFGAAPFCCNVRNQTSLNSRSFCLDSWVHHNPLAAQDMGRILACLQKKPGTSVEIARALRLTVNRVNGLLLELRAQGLVHAPSCTIGSKGGTVNVWACREAEEGAR